MTYNFDPEQWLENQVRLLESRRASGELAEADFERERAVLERRYEEMVARLDGSFQIPGPRAGSREGDGGASGEKP